MKNTEELNIVIDIPIGKKSEIAEALKEAVPEKELESFSDDEIIRLTVARYIKSLYVMVKIKQIDEISNPERDAVRQIEIK